MGLSSKQVSSDGLNWGETFNLQSDSLVELPKRRQSQIEQPDPLPCPRCSSKNTKFCYYNNYNKLQPRHYCKACKRHWTKGGTLRNVPVGGGRKNKRIKATATSSNTISRDNQSHQQTQNLSLALGDQNDIFGMFSQCSNSTRGNNANSNFLGNPSVLPLFQNQMPPFTISSLGSFGIENTSSLNGNSSLVGLASLEDNDNTTINPSACFASQTWQAPATNGAMDVPIYWNWDDVDPLVSGDSLNLNWDDSHEIKP